MLPGRTFIARHGETVFNKAQRMQGDALDSPLTRTGFVQADAMGAALAKWLGTAQALRLHVSPSGRALQTLAVVCHHIGHDWFEAERDDRLKEIDVGAWAGRTYAEIIAEQGEIVDRENRLFSVRPPGGEYYPEIAERLSAWIAGLAQQRGDRLVIMHGMSSRVLRGLLLGLAPDPAYGAPIAPSLTQGTLVMIGNGEEKVICDGAGTHLA
ncbi:MAG: histidine phosphatase family protein [Sphingomonadaceae bacterium]